MMSIWPSPVLCERPFWKAGCFVIVHFQGGISSWSGASTRVCSAGVVLVCHQCPAWTQSLLGCGAVQHTHSWDWLSRKTQAQESSSKSKSFQTHGIFHFFRENGLFHGCIWESDAMKSCRHRADTDMPWLWTLMVFQVFWPPSTFFKLHLIELVLKTSEEKHMVRKERELCASGAPYCPEELLIRLHNLHHWGHGKFALNIWLISKRNLLKHTNLKSIFWSSSNFKKFF